MRAPGYYLQRAWTYQQDVLTGRVPACRWVRLAMERNARDLERQQTPDFPYTFSVKAAEKVCRSVEQFPHIKGPKAKMVPTPSGFRWQTIDLEPWQCWIICVLWGWLKVETRTRRFRIALIFIPRKNAKSTLAAALSLHMLVADGESGAEIYSAATKKDQARIVYTAALQMAKRSPEFKDFFGVLPMEQEIRSEQTASVMQALSADDSTMDGLNPHFAVVDELHAHKTRGVWDVLDTALGSREQPMLFAITTAGTTLGGICDELRMYGQKLVTNVMQDESFFFINYTIDEGDLERWNSEEVLRKANPNYGVSVSAEYLKQQAVKASHTPAALNNFLTKHLDVPVHSASPWMPMEEWNHCVGRPMEWTDFEQAERAVMTVDLAEVRDIASIVVTGLFPDGVIRAKAKHFYPEAAVENSPVAQMSGWVHEGHLTQTPGNVQDFSLLQAEIEEIWRVSGVSLVGFDRALAAHLMQNLQKTIGHANVIEIPQQVKVMNPAMKALLQRVLSRTFSYAPDPVLTWMVSNVAEKKNHLEECYPVKAGGKDSHDKIDGAVALLMGVHELMQALDDLALLDDPNYRLPEIGGM